MRLSYILVSMWFLTAFLLSVFAEPEINITKDNNYWGEVPHIEGYGEGGITEEETESAYSYGRAHLLNYNISYENGMKEYIEKVYKESYPKEMGLCVEARVENETMIIYNHSPTIIHNQDSRSIRFDCEEYTENTVRVHSHPDIQKVWNMCYPSTTDVYSDDIDYGMIVCGVGEEVTEVLAYRTESHRTTITLFVS